MKSKKKAIIIIVAIVILAAAGGGGAWMYHSAQLEKMRTAGVEALEGSVDMDQYRSAQQEEIQTILTDSEKKIMESKDQESVDQISKEATEAIGKIKTDAQLDIEEGIKKLESSVDLKAYREAQQEEVKSILNKTKKAIKSAESEKEINSLLEDASSQIGEIKTDEQLTAEEEAARQAAARAAQAKKASKKSSKKKSESNNSEGCVGDDAANFY